MVTAQRNQLLANEAVAFGLEFAVFGVIHHALHFVASQRLAFSIPTLAGVHQALDAPLDGAQLVF